MAVFKARAAQH